MSGLLLCGKRTKNPYIVKEAGIGIYSIEELCYYLYNNTYMLDISFFCDELVDFVTEELELPSLGQKLKYGIKYNSGLANMVTEILSSCEYYSEKECESIAEALNALGSKSQSERMKAKADMLFAHKKYVSAIGVYREILNIKEETQEAEYVANIWNSIGVVYTRQFLYQEAVECFRIACDVDRQEEYFDNMIYAAIFSRDDDLLENLAVQYGIEDDKLEQYMKAMENQKKILVKGDEYEELRNRLLYDGSMELSEYKEGIRRSLDQWKEEYRYING